MINLPQDQTKAMQVLLSMGRFARLPETQGMVSWLKTELMRLDTANRHEPDEIVYRQRQGACQLLEDIFNTADGADRKAELIRTNLLQKGVRP